MLAISCMTEQIGTETTMAYTLNEFFAESRALLKAEPQTNALKQISQRLGRLLSNPAFVAETFSDDMPPGKRELYHDPETDFYVLAHVQEGNKTGKPHSHGASWAIYGNAREHHRDDGMAPHQPGERGACRAGAGANIGWARADQAYGPGVIHSTAHPEKAWVIRVTGTDLDKLPRYHFRKQDRILEKA